jgi:hypothetical protein
VVGLKNLKKKKSEKERKQSEKSRIRATLYETVLHCSVFIEKN